MRRHPYVLASLERISYKASKRRQTPAALAFTSRPRTSHVCDCVYVFPNMMPARQAARCWFRCSGLASAGNSISHPGQRASATVVVAGAFIPSSSLDSHRSITSIGGRSAS